MDISEKSIPLGESFKTYMFDPALKQNVLVDVVLKEDYELVRYAAEDRARAIAAKALEAIVHFEAEEESDKADMILDFLEAFDRKMREDDSQTDSKQPNSKNI